jgi:uncharacterized membrane protein YgdD (TMEM256/DUF423 family)
MARQSLLFAAFSGLLLVTLGAFGAHALEGAIPPEQMTWWHKAVHYQGIHTLALLGTGLLCLSHPQRIIQIAGWFFLSGIVLFSGSLYVMALTDLRALGMVTPLGGTAFIAGWFALFLGAWRLPRP